MELIGKYNLKADREQVWAALNDPTILQQCIPGCETLTKASDTNFSASVVAKVGPVKAKFSGEVELTELSPPLPIKYLEKAKEEQQDLHLEVLTLNWKKVMKVERFYHIR